MKTKANSNAKNKYNFEIANRKYNEGLVTV